jgi:hypothetical protein
MTSLCRSAWLCVRNLTSRMLRVVLGAFRALRGRAALCQKLRRRVPCGARARSKAFLSSPGGRAGIIRGDGTGTSGGRGWRGKHLRKSADQPRTGAQAGDALSTSASRLLPLRCHRRDASAREEPAPGLRRIRLGVRRTHRLTRSPTHYDRRKAAGNRHVAAQRNLFNIVVGRGQGGHDPVGVGASWIDSRGLTATHERWLSFPRS